VSLAPPPGLASALGLPPTTARLPIPALAWQALCTGEALVVPQVAECIAGQARAALAPLLAPSSPWVGTALGAAAGIAHALLCAALHPACAPSAALPALAAQCLAGAPLDARRPLAQCVAACGGVGGGAAGFAPLLHRELLRAIAVGGAASSSSSAPGGGGRGVRGALGRSPLQPLGAHFAVRPVETFLGLCCLARALELSGGVERVSAVRPAPALPQVQTLPAAALDSGRGGGGAGSAGSAAQQAASGAAAARLNLLSKGLQAGRGKR